MFFTFLLGGKESLDLDLDLLKLAVCLRFTLLLGEMSLLLLPSECLDCLLLGDCGLLDHVLRGGDFLRGDLEL